MLYQNIFTKKTAAAQFKVESLTDYSPQTAKMRTLIVCRGPIAYETIQMHIKNKWTMPHVIISEKEWIGEKEKSAPWIKDLPPENIHKVKEYNDVPKVLEICQKEKIDRVYPGYGFLAENAEFARKVNGAGMKWIGPSPEALERVGDKDSALELAKELNIPTVPNDLHLVDFARENTEEAFLKEATRSILEFSKNYPNKPVRLKHPEGGGGKGQVVFNYEDLLSENSAKIILEGFQKVWGEIGVSALDHKKGVVIELNLHAPLHWEVQAFGDGQNVVHFSARDCSIQNDGYQKMIEVSLHQGDIGDEIKRLGDNPDPIRLAKLQSRQKALDNVLNDAVRIGKHIGLMAAATIEFLIDENGQHYFLEVNPRVQVEHGVTEGITRVKGLDVSIVELQHRVASGEKIKFSQHDITFTGHTIELRHNAWKEDLKPALGGIIEYLRYPQAKTLRIEGAGIDYRESPWYIPSYDANFALLIESDASRHQVIERLISHLENLELRGNDELETNASTLIGMLTLLKHLPTQTEFRTNFASLWTSFVALFLSQKENIIKAQPKLNGKENYSPFTANFYHRVVRELLTQIFNKPSQFFSYYIDSLQSSRTNLSHLEIISDLIKKYKITLFAEEQAVFDQLTKIIFPHAAFSEDEKVTQLKKIEFESFNLILAVMRKMNWEKMLVPEENYQLSLPTLQRNQKNLTVLNKLLAEELRPSPLKGDTLLAGGAGKVYLRPNPKADKFVSAGKRVKIGDNLLLTESMKMFTYIASPIDGYVAEVLVEDGQSIEKGIPLIKFKIDTEESAQDEKKILIDRFMSDLNE